MPPRPQQQQAPQSGIDLQGLVRFVQQLAEGLNRVIAGPLGRPVLKEGVTFGVAGSVNITHNLGRPVRRYIVVSKSAPADISDGTSPDPATTLTLTSSAACTIDLLLL